MYSWHRSLNEIQEVIPFDFSVITRFQHVLNRFAAVWINEVWTVTQLKTCVGTEWPKTWKKDFPPGFSLNSRARRMVGNLSRIPKLCSENCRKYKSELKQQHQTNKQTRKMKTLTSRLIHYLVFPDTKSNTWKSPPPKKKKKKRKEKKRKV